MPTGLSDCVSNLFPPRRSTDYGSTYERMNDKVGSKTVLSYLYVCPTNKRKVRNCHTLCWFFYSAHSEYNTQTNRMRLRQIPTCELEGRLVLPSLCVCVCPGTETWRRSATCLFVSMPLIPLLAFCQAEIVNFLLSCDMRIMRKGSLLFCVLCFVLGCFSVPCVQLLTV